MQYALTSDDDGRRLVRRQPRRLPRRQRPRLLLEPARSALSRARQPPDAAGARRPTSPRRRRSCRASALPYANFSGTIGQMLRPFPQYSGVTDVYGNVARSTLPLAAADRSSSGGRRGSRSTSTTRSAAPRTISPRAPATTSSRTGRSASTISRTSSTRSVVYDVPFGAEGQAGQRQCVRARARERLAGVGHHAVPIGPAARLDPRRVQSAERGHLLRGLQPGVLRARADQRRLRRRRRARHEPAVLHRSQRVRVGAGVHLRQHAAHAGVRSAQPELLQPGPERATRLRRRRRR